MSHDIIIDLFLFIWWVCLQNVLHILLVMVLVFCYKLERKFIEFFKSVLSAENPAVSTWVIILFDLKKNYINTGKTFVSPVQRLLVACYAITSHMLSKWCKSKMGWSLGCIQRSPVVRINLQVILYLFRRGLPLMKGFSLYTPASPSI